ncbi:hypothetical protein GGR22_002046 [Flavobacterium gossypii]|uniref:Uncharacterized protein n=1 Tax=Flavobacterium gossypii TaxID=1646119 RepID=A0ABR6DQY0_9FLAO|nr:hypothetical protein [Flavobacterium gossypii]MBA9073879.1 hypothetical protein [Flavobacterium gossypii]
MKKTAFLILLVLTAAFSYGQKKGSKKKAAAKPASAALAKADNLTAEIVKGNFYLFINNKAKKDTIGIKTVDEKNPPKNCTLKGFTAKGIPLYLLTWTEEITTKTELKTEVRTILFSEVYDTASKTKLFSNQQTTTNITEKVFLDRLKNASETQEKVRREGFEFVLTPEGDILQKNKTQQNTFAFNAADKKYVEGKTTSTAPAAPAKKKKA